MNAEELVPVVEVAAPERLIDGMVGIIELDEDVLVAVAMVRAARAQHDAELRPVLMRAGPACEGHRRSVHAHQSTASVNELE